jgi:cell division protein FtsL
MNCKINEDKKIISCKQNSLVDIQKLITDLNQSLLELKKEKDDYQSRISECRGLCHEIRELMDATAARIIAESDRC